jgi:hypothetical protein
LFFFKVGKSLQNKDIKEENILDGSAICFKLSVVAKIVIEYQWLTPVILATQEEEIRRIEIQSQPGQRVHKTSS